LLLERLTYHLRHSKLTVISTARPSDALASFTARRKACSLPAMPDAGRVRKPWYCRVTSAAAARAGVIAPIQPNGAVTPCVYISDIEVGNLRRKRFTEIWNNPLFDRLCDREDRGDHCRVCDYRNYCGGCRARAYAYTGDITAAIQAAYITRECGRSSRATVPRRRWTPK
jgi:radical SAM protein with 4Fe4S-binding SPASM domain